MAGRASELFDPYELLGVLQGQGVSFVVIGAFARVVQGTRELTDGVDITPSMRGDNLARLARALDDLDARRGDGKTLDLRTLEGPVLELETRAGELKLVPEPAGSRGYEDLRWQASREPLGGGLRPQVASPGDLARMLGALDQAEDADKLLRLRRLITLQRTLGRQHSRSQGIER